MECIKGTMAVRELEKVFIGRGEVKGFYFEQVAKSDKAYLYRVTCTEGARPYYEIFERRINTQFDNISYPKSKAFGRWAWTTYDEDKAWHLFAGLNISFEVVDIAENMRILRSFFGDNA